MRIKKGWMPLKLIEIKEETHDTRTLFFVDAETNQREFDYYAGQYLTFRFDEISEKPVVRSYTMSSAPSEPQTVSITVKETAEAFVSRYLAREVKKGDILRARGPIGKFVLPHERNKHIVFIACGSGVTPFISMIKESLFLQKNNSLHLIVSYRSLSDIIFKNELEEFAKNKVQVDITLSREETHHPYHTGRISPNLIDKLITTHSNKTFMLCGPQQMMDDVTKHLLYKGVAPENIKNESFA